MYKKEERPLRYTRMQTVQADGGAVRVPRQMQWEDRRAGVRVTCRPRTSPTRAAGRGPS